MKRRNFLHRMTGGALGTTGAMSALFNLRMVNNALASQGTSVTSDYKALVCLFLAGGNDSFNMLTPDPNAGNGEWGYYSANRGGIALDSADVVPLGDGLHALNKQMADALGVKDNPNTANVNESDPSTAFKELFLTPRSGQNSSDLAFVSNVGTLVEPITDVAEYHSRQKKVPLGLFSHSDQISHWQTSLPNEPSRTGWAGRMADLLNPTMNTATDISMNISFAGNNIFQAGNEVTAFSANGALPLRGGFVNQQNTIGAFDKIIDHPNKYYNLFDEAFRQQLKSSRPLREHFLDILNDNHSGDLVQGLSGHPLDQAAQTIIASAAYDGANPQSPKTYKRQTYFVMIPGWDDHDGVAASGHGKRLATVGHLVAKFWHKICEAGLADNVTLFSASDFGRAIKPNGNGTDHAWGGNHFVLGGAVNGGQVYGSYPTMNLTASNSLDVGTNGRFLPKIAVDDYFAQLAHWFGVGPLDMEQVLPNIKKFYNNGPYNPNLAPAKFMNIS